jgi:hypothetical protein
VDECVLESNQQLLPSVQTDRRSIRMRCGPSCTAIAYRTSSSTVTRRPALQTGIEDAALLAPDAVNYFAAAWNVRSFVDKAVGRELPDDALSLAVNSPLARSQNQLHIHIDCIHADLRSAIARDGAKIGEH